ncbi:protein ACCELERATED CELL DEATH 6-like isoform X2 [Vitis riparia]|uniref:protein ACCELERATED CELL DEATH 6-like isoform X2 n=1 Tax=Vitis riparia TaxID=96939 RepID=UPI00155A8F6A|nr:protein ACCELERATED CELL DEATH 6-like isoform X2 [Vitis riparia]
MDALPGPLTTLLTLFGFQIPIVKHSLTKLVKDSHFVSPGKNTALHLAARIGDKRAVEELLNLDRSLLTEKNIKGNTPLHLAARFGHVDVVEFLIFRAQNLDVENGGVYEVISMRNMKDDTPLHEAVRGGHHSVTRLLVKKVVEANRSDLLASRNNAGESPFSMAIDVNYFGDIVRTILDAESSCLLHRGPNDETPLHRAVLRDDLDLGTIAILLEKRRELISETDGYGRTPLHCAAASGALRAVGRLLQEDASIALLQDRYQATPAHLAAKSDETHSLITILIACPNSVELLNQHSQNILHVAAQNGSVNVVNYILSLLEADDMINEPDKDGNTPLHLAVMNFHSRVVRDLVKTNEVDIGPINNDGKTALEIAQTQRDYIRDARKKDKQALSYIYQAIDENAFEKISCANTAKEAWEILKDSYKTVDKRAMDRSSLNDDEEEEEDKINETQFIIDILKAAYAKSARNPKDILDRKKRASKQINGFKTRKEMAGALILMATLIATVTFAAAFTIPGGFQAEDPHKGMVVLGRNVAFRTFIITDTIAMTSSMMAALILIIMPFQTDEEIIKSFLGYSLALLWLALMAMGIAFVTGLYAVLSEQLPLAIVVCCIGCILPLIIYYGPSLLMAPLLKEP